MDYLKEIYPSQLTVEKANKSDHLADYLDLTFIIDNGSKLSTWLYDKRDGFDFHTVNFPFFSSNIPSGFSYGVYISQLIRYARCCSHYDDFRYHNGGTHITKDCVPHGTEHPHGIQDIPHMHHESPTVLSIPNGTQDIPHNTHDIPHGTEPLLPPTVFKPLLPPRY